MIWNGMNDTFWINERLSPRWGFAGRTVPKVQGLPPLAIDLRPVGAARGELFAVVHQQKLRKPLHVALAVDAGQRAFRFRQ